MGEIELLEKRVTALSKIPDHLVIVSTGFDDNALSSIIIEK